jgi:hypothetical protein
MEYIDRVDVAGDDESFWINAKEIIGMLSPISPKSHKVGSEIESEIESINDVPEKEAGEKIEWVGQYS